HRAAWHALPSSPQPWVPPRRAALWACSRKHEYLHLEQLSRLAPSTKSKQEQRQRIKVLPEAKDLSCSPPSLHSTPKEAGERKPPLGLGSPHPRIGADYCLACPLLSAGSRLATLRIWCAKEIR